MQNYIGRLALRTNLPCLSGVELLKNPKLYTVDTTVLVVYCKQDFVPNIMFFSPPESFKNA